MESNPPTNPEETLPPPDGETSAPPATGAAPGEGGPAPSSEEMAAGFTSSHTSNFPELLKQLGISLLVSTYQAGRLIVVRADEDALNTHFRFFMNPMGMAYDPATGRLGLGTKNEVWELRNQPDVAPTLEPKGKHDAAFLPRTRHHSGDIRIHEIAWLNGELWAVNTRFSCLCTFDREHSFTPRWKPRFVTAYAPEDRCHLNGMAVLQGRPAFVTCLGQTDTAGGWRVNKVDGGCLLSVATGEVVLDKLSMPHSPRIYNGKFFLLESGHGTISRANLKEGTTEEITRLPGFTRGLDFYGPYAFVGLSQVRETAVFGGVPLVEELPQKERACGVWVVDLRNGKTVAFLRFEGIVQEIFAVQVLPNILYPDVVVEQGIALDSSFVLPDEALEQVPETLRGAAALKVQAQADLTSEST